MEVERLCERASPLQTFMLAVLARRGGSKAGEGGEGGESELVRNWYR